MNRERKRGRNLTSSLEVKPDVSEGPHHVFELQQEGEESVVFIQTAVRDDDIHWPVHLQNQRRIMKKKMSISSETYTKTMIVSDLVSELEAVQRVWSVRVEDLREVSQRKREVSRQLAVPVNAVL